MYSGHLARHNRIHTGEKNFACLYPGCPSRFSRQDNMMQHYRTHMSARSRSRVHSQNGSLHATAASSIPRPHAHTRIHSDSSAITPLSQNQHSAIPSEFPPNKHLEYFSAPTSPSLPPLHKMIQDSPSLDISLPPPRTILPVPKNIRQVDENTSSSGLLQLAHIVSTFGWTYKRRTQGQTQKNHQLLWIPTLSPKNTRRTAPSIYLPFFTFETDYVSYRPSKCPDYVVLYFFSETLFLEFFLQYFSSIFLKLFILY
jgi:hypothetical protein